MVEDSQLLVLPSSLLSALSASSLWFVFSTGSSFGSGRVAVGGCHNHCRRDACQVTTFARFPRSRLGADICRDEWDGDGDLATRH